MPVPLRLLRLLVFLFHNECPSPFPTPSWCALKQPGAEQTELMVCEQHALCSLPLPLLILLLLLLSPKTPMLETPDL